MDLTTHVHMPQTSLRDGWAIGVYQGRLVLMYGTSNIQSIPMTERSLTEVMTKKPRKLDALYYINSRSDRSTPRPFGPVSCMSDTASASLCHQKKSACALGDNPCPMTYLSLHILMTLWSWSLLCTSNPVNLFCIRCSALEWSFLNVDCPRATVGFPAACLSNRHSLPYTLTILISSVSLSLDFCTDFSLLYRSHRV